MKDSTRALITHMLIKNYQIKPVDLEFPLYCAGEGDIIEGLKKVELGAGYRITDQRVVKNGFNVLIKKDNTGELLFEITGVPSEYIEEQDLLDLSGLIYGPNFSLLASMDRV
jgi:hypothetical protein